MLLSKEKSLNAPQNFDAILHIFRWKESRLFVCGFEFVVNLDGFSLLLSDFILLRIEDLKQGNYSLRRPPKLIIPQAVIRH